jgi:hypothetical protein
VAQFNSLRRPFTAFSKVTAAGLAGICLLGHFKRVFNFDSQVPDGTLPFWCGQVKIEMSWLRICAS